MQKAMTINDRNGCIEAEQFPLPAIDGALEVVRPGALLIQDNAREFDSARQFLEAAHLHTAAAAAFMVLLGVELKRLRVQFRPRRGGDRRLQYQSFNAETLISWEDRIQSELGISKTTAWRFEAMAEAAKKRIAELNADELLTTPICQLTEPRRAAILQAVHKVTDGQTAQQLMLDWGIAKKPQGSGCVGGNKNGRPSNLSAEEIALQTAQIAWLPVYKQLFALRNSAQQTLLHLPVDTDSPADEAALLFLLDEMELHTALIKEVIAIKRLGAR